jgi:hypothetical protein
MFEMAKQKMIDDYLCFLSNGVMVAIFKQIADPNGVANLAKSAKRGSPYTNETNYMSDAPLRLT